MPSAPGPQRIGAFARRVGVSPELLRAWEKRYGLLQPVRSPGGFRLYSDEDAERVQRMHEALEAGLFAAEAARVALSQGRPPEGVLDDAGARLLDAIKRYDESAVQAVLDESLAGLGLESILRELVLPTLAQLGEDWDKDALGISQEHFASNLIRGRLLSLARLWGRGTGPLALLACLPGEAHDISLLAFGLVLRSHGWRILFLGADVPTATLTQTARTTDPAIVVVASFDASLFKAQAKSLRQLGRSFLLAAAGPGATDSVCDHLQVRRLDGDLIIAAQEVARTALSHA